MGEVSRELTPLCQKPLNQAPTLSVCWHSPGTLNCQHFRGHVFGQHLKSELRLDCLEQSGRRGGRLRDWSFCSDSGLGLLERGWGGNIDVGKNEMKIIYTVKTGLI